MIESLVAEYGSPLYVYDLAEVRAAYADLAAALPAEAGVLYSLKANPHPAVVETLVTAGAGAEVSSVGELRAALAAGANPERVLYTGPGKTVAEIREALASGVRWFSTDSPADVRRIGEQAKAAGVVAQAVVRVNPPTGTVGAGLAMTGEASQFGADAGWIEARPDDFAHPGVEVRGFHVFLASNLPTTDALLQAATVALETVAPLAKAVGAPVELLDLGGGFGHPFARPGDRPDFRGLREPLTALLADLLPPGTEHVAFESGRYLAGACGRLVATVQDVKPSQGRTFAVLDSGIHHLGGMYGLRRVPSLGLQLVPAQSLGTPRLVYEAGGSPSISGDPQPVDVVGPLCTPLDAWARGADLPPLAPGDLVVVPNVGAYGLTASLVGFLGRDCPVEVVVDGDVVVGASQLSLQRAPVGAGQG